MYKVNGELFYCVITYSGRDPSREGDMQNSAQLVLLNGSSKFDQNFTVGFLKLLSIHPNPHCLGFCFVVVVLFLLGGGGNFPFKAVSQKDKA